MRPDVCDVKWVNSDKFCPTDNSAVRLIHTKNLYSDGDELSVVDCILVYILVNKFHCRGNTI